MTDTANPVLPLGMSPEGDAFAVESQQPNVSFLRRAVQPPSALYVAIQDQLVINWMSSASAEVITVTYRLLRFDGKVILGRVVSQIGATTYTVQTKTEPLAEGFLLSMTVQAKQAKTRGQTFVRLLLNNSGPAGGISTQLIMSDYITTATAGAFPNGRAVSPLEGPGNPIVHSITNPGAGAGGVIAPATNQRWSLKALRFRLTTDATVANRQMQLQINVGGSVVYLAMADKVQAASLTFDYVCAQCTQFINPSATVSTITIPPNLILSAVGADSINLNTIAGSGGDAQVGFGFAVEEWFDGI